MLARCTLEETTVSSFEIAPNDFSNNRFTKVAQLKLQWYLKIEGKISTSMLSDATTYATYLVYKFTENASGFDQHPAEVSIGTMSSGIKKSNVVLALQCAPTPPRRRGLRLGRGSLCRDVDLSGLQNPTIRTDGWLEIELGEYFNACGDDGELQMSVVEVMAVKTGLIVQGIEIRPNVTI